MSCVFRENQYGDSSTLLMGTNEIFLVHKEIFRSDLKKARDTNFSEKSVWLILRFVKFGARKPKFLLRP
jgi:hypothetical protein